MIVEYELQRWSQVFDPNPAMLRLTMVQEGFKVFQWCDHPGSVYGDHFHPMPQSHWIISGTLELTIENYGVVVLEKGDRDLLPANVYHSARVIGEESVHYLVGEKL